MISISDHTQLDLIIIIQERLDNLDHIIYDEHTRPTMAIIII